MSICCCDTILLNFVWWIHYLLRVNLIWIKRYNTSIRVRHGSGYIQTQALSSLCSQTITRIEMKKRQFKFLKINSNSTQFKIKLTTLETVLNSETFIRGKFPGTVALGQYSIPEAGIAHIVHWKQIIWNLPGKHRLATPTSQFDTVLK